MTGPSFVTRIDQLCASAGEEIGGAEAVPLEDIRRRLHSPLRIAVAGRVKAGKSTLLNAMVGERLAPTDAGECTRMVSSYHFAPQYDVKLRAPDGSASSPAFRKGDESLEVDLPGGVAPEARLEIGWPARRLSDATLIDTPGLGSLDPALKQRGRSLFSEDGAPGQADAVIYLMRHAHSEDIDFLEGFREAGLPFSSPVNTVAVLSRVDEIGAGRLDALDSASRIASRYERDERIGALAGSVLPVAGLLAETAVTMEESDFNALRQVGALGAASDALLLSVDRFRDGEHNPLAAETRELLLRRFGLFGIRFAVDAFRTASVPSSQALAELLRERSGLVALQELVQQRFTARSQQLVARSALAELRTIARQLRSTETTTATRLEAAIEEIVGSSHELAELELAHQVATGEVRFDDAERTELDRLLASASSPARALGLGEGASAEAMRSAALGAISRWRERAAHPLTDRATRWGADVMTRSYEGMYARLIDD